MGLLLLLVLAAVGAALLAYFMNPRFRAQVDADTAKRRARAAQPADHGRPRREDDPDFRDLGMEGLSPPGDPRRNDRTG